MSNVAVLASVAAGFSLLSGRGYGRLKPAATVTLWGRGR